MNPSSTLSRNFPTLRYVVAPVRWFFRSRRRVLAAAAVLLAMIITPPLWWSVQLLGLPDIGEPFDLQALRSFTIPDERNAFVLYRRAAASLKPIDPSSRPIRRLDSHWSTAEPALRQWLEENRAALDVYRRGSDRPDAFDGPPPERFGMSDRQPDLMPFYFLALLEASRLEERGDMAGAWDWYRAVIRANYHQGRYASVWRRLTTQGDQSEVRHRVGSWVVDSRTTPAVLRRALDDLVACEEILPSDAYTMKAEYPALERTLEGPENPGQGEPYARLNAFFKSSEIRPTPEQLHRLSNAWRRWRREPERSRRVLRLAVANWVAYYDLPRGRRPKPPSGVRGPFVFYPLAPEASSEARAVPPAELSRWLASTIDADALLRSWVFMLNFRRAQLQDQAGYRALVLLVASELHRRERGTDPPSDESLVGPYLKALPDDGTGETGDPSASGPPGAIE